MTKQRKDEMVVWILRFLKWFCPSHLYEEIEGDLLQRFNRDVKACGKGRAKKKLLWNVIRFFRPGIVFRNKFSLELNHLYMVRAHVILAGRGLIRNKVFSMINLLGLSVSMVVCIMIFQYVKFELSYDDFHQHSQRIYRVATKVTLQNEVITHETNTYEGISKALTEDFPEVSASTSIRQFNSDGAFVRYENPAGKLLPLQTFKAFDVDSLFFSVFSFQLLEGNAQLALQRPFSAVISETLSHQCFAGDAIGKILEVYDGTETKQYKITGVLKDVPPNSHIKFDLLTRSHPRDKNFWNGNVGFWDWGGHTYVLLNNKSDRADLENKLARLAHSKNGLKNNKDDYGQVSTFELQKLTDIHLFSHLQEELESNGSGALVYALVALAIIVIIIAWVNYINLSTAISEEKIKSIGVRKVIGASPWTLMLQVLTESAMFNVLSVVIAIVLVHLLLPSFSTFAGIPLDHSALHDEWVIIFVTAFVFVSTLMAGLYPAFVIASFNPVRALKAKMNVGNSFTLRKALVVFQFAAAVVLMISTVVAYKQLSFMQTKELGINIDRVVIIKALNFDKETWSNEEGGYSLDSVYLNKANRFREDVRNHTGFSNATSLSHLPGQLPNWGTEFKAPSIDAEKAYRLFAVGIDYDFLSTMQVKLLAGRNFSPDFPSDRGNEGKRAVLLNEAAAKLLGFKTPEEAVHMHLSTYWGADYEIIGVVNSFHQLSFKENLQPLYFILQPRALAYFAVAYKGEKAGQAVEQLHTIWKHHFPDYPFNYFFLDQYFDKQYQYDETFTNVVGLLACLAIFIACLGLFGLTSYAIVRRTKEIGIRKVLGATVTNVIGLFTRDFVKLMLLANVVGVTMVYFGVKYWLENYAFKIELGWWLFAIPMILILVIALLTITLQSIKVALQNPVNSLRSE